MFSVSTAKYRPHRPQCGDLQVFLAVGIDSLTGCPRQ
jgi:hypothetical protein